MLAGLSSRRYPRRVGAGRREGGAARDRDKQVGGFPAVFRRFVAATETALAELLAAPLGELDLVALMVNQAGPASPNSPGF